MPDVFGIFKLTNKTVREQTRGDALGLDQAGGKFGSNNNYLQIELDI